MNLKERISEDMKTAMKSRETDRLAAIRLILAALKQKEVDERIELSDTDVVTIIEKMLKQRRDSISQFESAGRNDLADKEKFEVSILQAYMPQPLTDEEVATIVASAVTESGASSVKDMGKVMGLVKSKVAGRADMGKVSALIKTKLGN